VANTDPEVRSSGRAHKITFYNTARPNLGIRIGHCSTSNACRDVCLVSQEPMIPLEERFYNILIEFGPHEMVSLTKMCLNKTHCRVRVVKYLPDVFPISNGLKQRDALTP
jgi:hypothetical protein